jgi:PAS domain-containing protein
VIGARHARAHSLDLLEIDKTDLGDRSITTRELYDGEGAPVPDADRPWRRAFETGRSIYDFQCRIDRSGDDHAWLSINAVPLEGDLSAGDRVVVSIEDITERKQREEELELYETIVETIDDGVYVLDEEHRFAMVNEAYAQMTNYDREELLGAHCSRVSSALVSEEAAEERVANRRR